MTIDDPLNDDQIFLMRDDSCLIDASHSARFPKNLQPICLSEAALQSKYFGEKSGSNRTYVTLTWRDGEEGEPFLWQEKVVTHQKDGKHPDLSLIHI